MSNNLDPDQGRYFVWPDLGPNCLLMLLVNDTSRQRVNYLINPVEPSGKVCDSRLRDCRFEPHRPHCIVSLSKTPYSLLGTGSNQEDPFRHN